VSDELRSLLLYLDAPSPQESVVRALGNMVGIVSPARASWPCKR
jgi:hypothetical protein